MMLGGKKNRNECVYGCCRDINYNGKLYTKKRENKLFRAREKRDWKKENNESSGM